MNRVRLIPLAVLGLALAQPFAAAGADAERGRALYETRCDGCHAESVHGRARREASSFESIRGWVRRWSGNLGLKWTAEEIDDVTVYLNGRYYRFACPPAACKVTGQSEGAPRVASKASAASP